MLIYLLVLHFIADFLLQSREMGKKKSVEFSVLMDHLGIQAVVFTIGLMPFVGFGTALVFSGLNVIAHGIIDWNIWRGYKLTAHLRINKELDKYANNLTRELEYRKAVAGWKYWEDHWFYSTIGLDQLLHTATLVLLWSWLC